MGKISIKHEEWKSLFVSQKSYSEEDNKEEFVDLISSYFFLFDCFENKILFVNTAFETLTGHDAKDFTVDFLIDMIHPDDVNYFFQSEERGVDFTNKLSFNEHFRYTLNYTYRIRTKSGEYITIQQECQAIEVNNSGHLTKTIVNHRRIPNYETRPKNDHKIYDKLKNIYIDSDNCYNLTTREFEILNLIREGNNSAQIAELLSLSKFTVTTHRKNILNKTDSKSFIELIKKLSFSHLDD